MRVAATRVALRRFVRAAAGKFGHRRGVRLLSVRAGFNASAWPQFRIKSPGSENYVGGA